MSRHCHPMPAILKRSSKLQLTRVTFAATREWQGHRCHVLSLCKQGLKAPRAQPLESMSGWLSASQ